MALSLAQATAQIDQIFSGFGAGGGLISNPSAAGKLYEAWVLTVVLQRLQSVEGFQVAHVGGSMLHLKSAPGPINSAYPHFELMHPTKGSFKLWTDVEFTTLSYARAVLAGRVASGGTPGRAFRHELDLVLVPSWVSGYVPHHQVRLGVECKHTASFTKLMARAALGVRRELSVLRDDEDTLFDTWPRHRVPANPTSVFLVCSTDPSVVDFNEAGVAFGIDFDHVPII